MKPGQPLRHRQSLRQRQPLRRHGRLARHTPLRQCSPERREHRREQQFGEAAGWIRTLPCATCGASPPSEASHIARSRGAGGKSTDQAPQCRRCHQRLHQLGCRSYAAELAKISSEVLRQVRYPGLVASGDLRGLANAYAREFEGRTAE